eukprot:CAMPEP_0194150316 /NCGR_PEP_ID=MMETSP0152-20130528/42649_1 /TAXON_ID=1049557 /ORGANISM="Thalassiothrix antarctica, Strain L6-D1" /LENGTH=303 /DNA_ID=CAMNT_0038853177 /DNA_START=149 /DNA_END=1060 /DNA_ORIENTATION=-
MMSEQQEFQNSNDKYFCNEATSKVYSGKTVLITGASGGLGKCLAYQLAHCGVSTLVLCGRNDDALRAVEEECKNIARFSSNEIIIIHRLVCDLGDKESVLDMVKQALLLCHNRIDVLINNGGVSSRSKFLDTAMDVDEKVMQINFFAGTILAKGIVPGMVDRRYGKIIWISSVQGLFGIPNRTSYSASKFAVQGYCEALRSELAPSGITVHVASPGYINTNLSQSAVMGDGKTLYGKTDATTAGGADPNDVAIDVLTRSSGESKDFMTAISISARVALWLKFFAPSVLHKLLVKRFLNSEEQE